MRGRPLLRCLTAWALLVLHGLVASGLPLALPLPPAPGSAAGRKLAAKDRSRPFPCMDKACGCDSAERCFTNCCCHTPAETLLWAQARGLEPAVIAALARRAAGPESRPAAGTCCATTAPQPSCCETAEPATPSCCAIAAATGGSDDERAPGHAPPTKVVTLRAMLACGGIVAQWAAACVSLPPPKITTCEIPWPTIGTVVTADERPLGAGCPPDLPPPRGC